MIDKFLTNEYDDTTQKPHRTFITGGAFWNSYIWVIAELDPFQKLSATPLVPGSMKIPSALGPFIKDTS